MLVLWIRRLADDRGREGMIPSPPSEPCVQFSRTRLSSRWLSSSGLARQHSGCGHGEEPLCSEVRIWPATLIGLTPTKARALLVLAQNRPQSSADETIHRGELPSTGMPEVTIPALEQRVQIGHDPRKTVAARAARLRTNLVFQSHQALLPHPAPARLETVAEKLEALPPYPAVPNAGLLLLPALRTRLIPA